MNPARKTKTHAMTTWLLTLHVNGYADNDDNIYIYIYNYIYIQYIYFMSYHIYHIISYRYNNFLYM